MASKANTVVAVCPSRWMKPCTRYLAMGNKLLQVQPSAAAYGMAYHSKVDGLPESVGLLVLT